MKKTAFSLLFAVFFTALFGQKNTILLIADDMGTDFCGLYGTGYDTANMPNIRSLLRQGVLFERAWTMPYCSPTRAAVLTGRFPFRTGVGSVIESATDPQLDTAEVSICKVLKAAHPNGIATANIGKWHLHTPLPSNRDNPARMGYDHYSGNFIGQIGDYYEWQKIVDGAPPVTVTNYATTEQVDDAIQWLQTLDGSRPFFLWQAFNAPHTPYHLPPAGLHTVAGLSGTQQHINQNKAAYYKAMVEAMDTEIGRLLKWIDEHGLRDSTNIIFIGDNGDASAICQFPNSANAKGTLYQNGISVPMIVSGPAVVQPNRTSNALVCTADLFATILELQGVADWSTHIPVSRPVDAVSLLPILRNEGTAVRQWSFTELFEDPSGPGDGKAIRDESYKLIRFDDGREEFFFAANDPFDQTNLMLQLPLGPDAETHYNALCNALNTLLGTAGCQPISGIGDVGPGSGASVVPNPATGKVRLVQERGNMPTQVAIFDPKGQKMPLTLPIDNGEIDVSLLPNGLYWLKVMAPDGTATIVKLIKM